MQVNNTKNINFIAIIAEYNPLHAGHLAHIQQAKQTGLPLVVVLGGDFCQRGGDMFFDKYTRAKHALDAGADLVLEMPTVYATDCAEQFAKGGVRQLAPLGAGILSFGSECGDIDTLQSGVRLLIEEPPAVSETLRKELDQGTAYPIARAKAWQAYADETGLSLPSPDPNNILGMEYLRAIQRFSLPITAHTHPRLGAYHATDDLSNPSATALRTWWAGGEWQKAREHVSGAVYQAGLTKSLSQDVLYLHAVRTLGKEGCNRLYGAEEGLGNRLWSAAVTATTTEDMITAAHTKRYTLARIRRLATAALLGITKEKRQAVEQEPYFHILGMRKTAAPLKAALEKAGPVYTSHKGLKESPLVGAQIDATAHEIYCTMHALPVGGKMIVL